MLGPARFPRVGPAPGPHVDLSQEHEQLAVVQVGREPGLAGFGVDEVRLCEGETRRKGDWVT